MYNKFHNNENEAKHKEDRLLMQTHFKTFIEAGFLYCVLLSCICLVGDKNENTNVRIFSKRACRNKYR